ncbi:MAG: pirin family protein [Bacteriovorax sp.]|nr:pirin family protein [Bacteriovorax sp.]
MLTRKSEERGHNEISWLNSWHSFSFGQYYDPKWQGFNQLLVINEDYVAPSMGFGTHPHRDMEIITYVISGELKHQDSMGNLGIIKPGEIQVMSAGTGITHSEHNNKSTEPTHLLQIWVLPNAKNLKPRYDQQNVFDPNEFNFFKVIATPMDQNLESSAVSLNANAQFWLGRYNKSESLSFKPKLFKNYWIQLVKGQLAVNGNTFKAGDAVAYSASEEIKIEVQNSGAEFLIIEVA